MNSQWTHIIKISHFYKHTQVQEQQDSTMKAKQKQRRFLHPYYEVLIESGALIRI